MMKMEKGWESCSETMTTTGDADCYIGNDAGENFLYQNKGNGTFTNVGWMAGVEADENGNVQGTMGVDFGDYDNDGLLDLIAINYQQQPNALYRNDNGNFFTDVSFVAGMVDSLPYVGWGVDFFDADNDGDKDLLIANGHLQDTVEKYDDTTTYAQRNHLLINNGHGGFTDESVKAGNALQSRKVSRGIATADYDNDGDLDVLISNANDSPQLLRNDGGNQGNWILIRTIGTRSNRTGIGTRVKIQTDDLTQIDEVRGGSGYLSQNDVRLHFGIGTHKRLARIEARWPSRGCGHHTRHWTEPDNHHHGGFARTVARRIAFVGFRGVPTFGFQVARDFSGPTYCSSQFHSGSHLRP